MPPLEATDERAEPKSVLTLFNNRMKPLLFATCCVCILGCKENTKPSSQSMPIEQSDPKSQLAMRKADLEHITQNKGTVLLDAVFQPGEGMDLPHSAEFRRIGLCVNEEFDLSRSKGFVSLTGTDGSRLAADGRSEHWRQDGKPIDASFHLKNEGTEPRRVIVYTINVEHAASSGGK